MPKARRIQHWRNRRQKKDGRYGRLILKGLGVFVLLGLLSGAVLILLTGTAVTAVYASLTQNLPNFADLEQINTVEESFATTKIYAWGRDIDGDGAADPVLIYELIDPLGGDRQWVGLEQMPQSFINATIAIEDKSFWTNQGFDVEGMGRAFYEYLIKGGAVQGGSSITQQVVKNNLIEEERRIVGAEVGFDDYQRKLQELVLAREVTENYTKEQILEWYLNSNFYGNLAYGVEAAARVYFNKSAVQLTLPEVAMLAAIPQSPAMNPIDNPEEAKFRQELVLEAMYRDGYIDRETMVTAKYTPINVEPIIEDRFNIIAPHFAVYVRRELERRFGPELVLRGGLNVYTTLDLEMQSEAECVARAHVHRLSGGADTGLSADEQIGCGSLRYLTPLRAGDQGVNHQVNNASMVAIDPRTGEIKVMMGSLDYWNKEINGSFNVAVDGLRQPGSSFKPFTFLTGLSQGYNLATMLLDVEKDFGTEYDGVAYVPQNYDRLFHGPMRMRTALANSYNVPAVQLMSWVGVDNVIRTAHKMGITSLDKGPNQYGLSVTLGGGEVRLIDMVYAFAVLDNMGVMIGQPVPEAARRFGFRDLDPVAILRVEDRDGVVLYEYNQPEKQEIVTSELAFLMNDMMSDRQARCPAFGCPNALELPGNRPVVAKTGTTNDYRDAWTVGYTPQLVTAVWVGNTDNSPMKNVPGSKGAAPIWQAFMSWAMKDEPIQVWQRPERVVSRSVCDLSGLLPTVNCPTVSEFFIAGTEPNVYDNMYQEFKINRETGRLATVYTPLDLIETKIYQIYPDQAADWVRENKIPQPPDEYDTIYNPGGGNRDVWVQEPEPFSFVQGVIPILGTARIEQFASYRLSYFAGLSPEKIQTIVEGVGEPKENELLGEWDVSNLDGLYTLMLTVLGQDGRFSETTVQVTVDNNPPVVDLLFPLPGQEIFKADEWVIIQADVTDNISINRVEFYIDGSGVPFAISTVPPYTEKWTIVGPGCHEFHAVAVDEAGNETDSHRVPICIIEK